MGLRVFLICCCGWFRMRMITQRQWMIRSSYSGLFRHCQVLTRTLTLFARQLRIWPRMARSRRRRARRKSDLAAEDFLALILNLYKYFFVILLLLILLSRRRRVRLKYILNNFFFRQKVHISLSLLLLLYNFAFIFYKKLMQK